MPAGRERRLGTAREGSGCVAAVGLVADDDHRLPPAASGVADLGGGGAGREPLVDLWIAEPQWAGQSCGRLARPQQRARYDGVRLDALLAQPHPEGARLLATGRRERTKLVGGSRCCVGVADDHELHRGQDNRVTAGAGELSG